MTDTKRKDENKGRCCCGRIKGWTEPVIINNIIHERLGDEGAFCGPYWAHDIRDMRIRIAELEKENEGLKQALEIAKTNHYPLVRDAKIKEIMGENWNN